MLLPITAKNSSFCVWSLTLRLLFRNLIMQKYTYVMEYLIQAGFYEKLIEFE